MLAGIYRDKCLRLSILCLQYGNESKMFIYMSRLVGNPTMRFMTRSDTNRAVQSHKIARDWKF